MPDIYEPAGVDITAVTSTARFRLGQRAYGSEDQQYVYVLSSGTHAVGACVAIDENFTSRSATTTLGAEANSAGFAQVAFATDQYGWVAVHGHNLTARTKDNTAANAALYTSTSVGVLTSVASTSSPLLISGVRTVSAAASGGGLTTIIATYPTFTVHNEPSNN